MSLYLLDTDHLSLHQRDPDILQAHLSVIPADDIAITVITAEEQLRGRFLQVSKAKSDFDLILAYRRLRVTIGWLNRYRILDYEDSACRIFHSLRQQKIRIGTQDLRIASIALSTGGILVTRNVADFGQITGLVIEDWTK
jgi:tRNA(fMet)-specific endonuclease VapC